MIHKRLVIVLTVMWASVGAFSQEAGSLVELKEGALLYKSASVAGGDLSTPENCGELFMSAYLKGEYPYPFVQKVEKRQQGWLKIGPGWVKDGDVEALKTEPITEDALSNQYLGMLFEDKQRTGMATEYLMQFSQRLDNGDILIFFNNGDASFVFMGNLSNNLIKCTRYLPIKESKLGSKDHFAVELYRERDGLKMYSLIYPKRVNTQVQQDFLGELMSIDTFDKSKMTAADCKDLSSLISEYGRSTTLTLSANTLKRMTVYVE